MQEEIIEAKKCLWEEPQLSEHGVEQILGCLSADSVDGGDLFFQQHKTEHYVLEDGIVKNADYSVAQGMGARVLSGDQSSLAYTEDLSQASLLKVAQCARSIALSPARENKALAVHCQNVGKIIPVRYRSQAPLLGVLPEEKMAFLRELDRQARTEDPRVSEVMVSLAASYDTILLLNLEGNIFADRRPLLRVEIRVVVESCGRRESARVGGGGRYDFEALKTYCKERQPAKEAVRIALVNLSAKAAPAGSMPVVLGPGWPGVLLHEAVGHGLEGDFNRKGSSAYSGRMGEKVASSLCTVVDDGTLINRRGSLNIDDEGVATQENVLIENGILKGYLQDQLNAKLMGTKSTGNGRRESYATRVLPRMTNTFLRPGPHAPEEIIASVDNGIYAVNFDGGQVDITTGNFVFSTSEAYKIEKGKIAYPIKGATLIGNGPEIMHRISMLGNDLALDTGVGTCGKEGQSVPVGVGQPTLLIDQLTVGGTQHG
jgi:TldD protein